MQYFNLREHHRWIDYKTRVVFLDVDIYNATTRLFSHVKLFFEFPTLGSINMVKQVWSTNRYPYVHALAYFILLLQLIFIVIWCVRLVFFFIYMLRLRSDAIWAIHTYMRLFEVIFGAAAIIYCILRIHATIAAIASLRQSIGMVYFTNLQFSLSISFIHICGAVRDPIIKTWRGCDQHNRCNPATFVCLSQAKTWISNVICRGLFYVQ